MFDTVENAVNKIKFKKLCVMLFIV